MFKSLNLGALGINNLSLDESLALAAGAGFSGLDLPLEAVLHEAENSSLAAVAERFEAAGVRAGSWGLPVNFRDSDEVFQSGLSALPRYAEAAQALGSPWCSTWILPFSDTLDYDSNMERHVTRLRAAAEVLAQFGSRLGLEFVGPLTLRAGHTYPFIATMTEALEMGKRIGTGNIGLLLDCFHWYTAHGTLEDLATLHADDLVYIHLNDARPGRTADEQIDNQRLLPGESGLIDISGFLQAVQRTGFAGPVAVEPFKSEMHDLPAAERVQLAAESLGQVWQAAGLP